MSTIRLSPYVNFQGRAREATAFYRQVLGDELATLIVASDGHPDYPTTVGDNVALALAGTDQDGLTRIFNDLAAGGRIKMPLAQQPWGAAVGWLTDRFGVNWTISIDKT
ncbi:MAG: VOC family protein [Candidatus Methylomirabilaceae bacterium]